jgi:hypothetical protein
LPQRFEQNRAFFFRLNEIVSPHSAHGWGTRFARARRPWYSDHHLILQGRPQNRACPCTSIPIGVPHWSQVRPARLIRFSSLCHRRRHITLQYFRMPYKESIGNGA